MSLHVPLTPDTRHLIDKRALTRMKRSAYLINTARGPVVDEAALAWALQHHLLAGAALDVYENEPAVHPDLLSLENVLLVPHLASGTTETRTAMADLAAENGARGAGRPSAADAGPLDGTAPASVWLEFSMRAYCPFFSNLHNCCLSVCPIHTITLAMFAASPCTPLSRDIHYTKRN